MRLMAIGAALLGLLAAAPASAQDVEPISTENRVRLPNFLGTTGLLYTPSAYTIGDRTGAAHIHGNSDFVGGGVLAGFSDRFELGVTVLDLDDDIGSGDTEFLLNGKFLLLEERDNVPAISFGVIDALSELNGDVSWYVVASKYFTRADTEEDFALVGHLGYGDGIFDDSIFAGAELIFNRNFSAMAEFQNDDFNVGVRGRWREFAATVGLFDLKHFGAGVSYNARF
ncbi:MAG: hypothetical protein ACK47B_04780 [Armatimonadota bacterium]